MHRHHPGPADEAAGYGDRPACDDEDAPEGPEAGDPLHGAVFGEMVHEVLEAIDFAQVGQAPDPRALPPGAAALVEEVCRRHWPRLPARLTAEPAREEACRRELTRLVWNALHTPLAAAGGPLWQVPKGDRLHELEFLFPEWDGTPSPGVGREEGFLTGIIDLVFQRAGKLFLLDWKSNLLPAYTPAALARAMRDNDYVRQYRLYLQALARWLRRLHGARFEFLRDFGGVYYLFLRGLNGRDEAGGVFFHRPTADDLSLAHVLAS
jgi:exodeoxyribonuclease V beta subunit